MHRSHACPAMSALNGMGIELMEAEDFGRPRGGGRGSHEKGRHGGCLACGTSRHPVPHRQQLSSMIIMLSRQQHNAAALRPQHSVQQHNAAATQR